MVYYDIYRCIYNGVVTSDIPERRTYAEVAAIRIASE
jgi:hypothetical protein